MFTPQSKAGWAGWSTSPKVGDGKDNGSAALRTNHRSSLGAFLGRGKGATALEATPPQIPQLLEDNDAEVVGGSGVSEDWKRFRETGLLDERVLLRKVKEALSERLFAVESEKEWSSQIEELKQALIESQEILKREREAHIIAVSELEKREENLKRALGVEKQCVVDLEKALHEMRAEIAETKFTSEKKLADAHALEANLEEKKMEIEAKVHGADARLAEANRKNSEMDRKLVSVMV